MSQVDTTEGAREGARTTTINKAVTNNQLTRKGTSKKPKQFIQWSNIRYWSSSIMHMDTNFLLILLALRSLD